MARSAGQNSSRVDRKQDFSGEINRTVNPGAELKKGKVGRPSNGDVKKITLAIPAEMMGEIEIAASLFWNGNRTAYINALIKKDLDENLQKYKEFQSLKEK